MDAYRIYVRRVCRIIGLQRAIFAYKTCGRDNTVLRQRLRELVQVRVRYGSQRLYILLYWQGWLDDHKRVR